MHPQAAPLKEADAAPVAVYRLPTVGTPSPPAVAPWRAEQAWTEPLLRQNAIWFCQLRWIVVAVLALAGIASFFPTVMAGLGVALTPFWPLAAAVILTGTNVVFARLARQLPQTGRGFSVRWLLWSQIISDLLVLTVVIHWLGSGLPAAPFMYLFHLILACIVFSPQASLLVGALAAAFYVGCLLLESTGLLTAPGMMGHAAPLENALFSEYFLTFGVAPMLLVWIVIWYLVSRLAGTLRRRECELALTNLRLKASSEERAQHMLQTTHQLKAPFAAIHAQTQLLLGGYCGALPAAARDVAGKISARCLALSRQIQEMLQLANLRSRGQTTLPCHDLALDSLIEAAMARLEPSARQRGIRFTKTIEPVQMHAVEDHLTMVLDNLLVNAVNYSHDGGEIHVTCRPQGRESAVVTVRDGGIGIPAEKLPRIFDDYYRTDEAVQHNRTSTGLGLAIIRQVAQQTGMAVEVESASGQGTCFTVTLPTGQPQRLPDPGKETLI